MANHLDMTTSAPDRIVDRRRTIRIKRSALLQNRLDDIDRPSIKIAETRDELEQAFSLVYQEYLKLGYIAKPGSSQIHLTLYHVLPETAVFIFKSYLTVISTLTQIFDSKLFALPMDALYHDELNALRDRGRKLAELSALVTPSEARWRSIFLYLYRAIYWYAIYNKVDDLCITVNPKHVKFYKSIFFFEELGPERHYPKVGAPAVALRLDLGDFRDKLIEAYSALDFDCDLHAFFFRMTGIPMTGVDGKHDMTRKKVLDTNTIRYFFMEKTNALEDATTDQMDYIRSIYKDL